MADLKATSFRLNEEDLEKFKQFMDNEGIKTQADGFKAIMQSVEMAKAKGIIKDRAKEIEVFQDTINNLMSMFLNSLNVNQTSEERIREELSQEIQTKDNTISTMYDNLQALKADNKCLNEDLTNAQIEINRNMDIIQALNKDNADKQKSIDKLNSNNDLLQEQLNEFKQYKTEYKVLEKELNQLKATNKTLETDKTTLENTVTEYQGKLQNANSINKFYIDNISELKKDIETYKADMKSLEQQHKQEIINIKADNEKALEKDLKAIQEQLNNKNDIELQKKDLEIQKLNNTIEQLKSKDHKPGTNKQVNNNNK